MFIEYLCKLVMNKYSIRIKNKVKSVKSIKIYGVYTFNKQITVNKV